jgi:hypothetical protein
VAYNGTILQKERAMIELNEAQRREARAKRGARAVDPETGQEYVLVPVEVFVRLKCLAGEEEAENFGDDIYGHVMEIFGREGWNDPSMDVYDRLDPRRQS